MKCPKCGFFGPDYLDTCKKCGKDLTVEKARLGLNRQRLMRVRDQQAPGRESVSTQPAAPAPSDHASATVPRSEPPWNPPAPPPAISTTGADTRAPEPSATMPRQAPPVSAVEEPPISLDEAEDFGAPTEEESFAAPEAVSPPSAETSLDDFEFPDFTKSEPPPLRTASDDDSFSRFSLTDPENEKTHQPSGTGEREGFSLGDIGASESLPQDGILSQIEPSDSLESEDKGAAKTRLLSPQEIEEILHNELPSTPEGPSPKTAEKAKTQLLDEDQLSDILGEFDSDLSKSK